MVSKNSLNKLYNYVLNTDYSFNTEQLYSFGFAKADIEKLRKTGVISNIGENLYQFEAVDDLFYIGKDLIKEGNVETGFLYLKKVLQLDPDHLDAWDLLLYNSIMDKKYDQFFELLDMMPQTEQKYHKRDYDYCLYLLNYITDIPEKYQNYIKFLSFYDISVPLNDTRFDNRVWENRVRFLTMRRKFKDALKEQSMMINSSEYKNVQDMIIRELLSEVVNYDNDFHATITDLIEKKEYNKVVELLSDREEKYGLSGYYYYALKLAETIKNMQFSKIVPEKMSMNEQNIFEAINTNNYDIALRMNKEFRTKKDSIDDDNILYLLLRDICNLISDIEKNSISSSVSTKDDYSNLCSCFSANNMEEFVSKCCDMVMKKRNIILLDPMTPYERSQIHGLVREHKNMTSFSIGEDPNRRVVLRKKPVYTAGYKLKEEIDLAKDLYLSGRYNKCIEKNLDILDHLKRPDSYIYTRLGFAYLKNGNLEQAITYFEVADALIKENNLPYDYSPLLRKLKCATIYGEKDIDLDMSEEDFSSGEDENELFNRVNDLVILSGMDVESACLQLNLNSVQIDTVKLLYAKEFFGQGMQEKGEQFLRSFESSENKTEQNKKMFYEINSNKKLYANKKKESRKQLVLTTRPTNN